MSGPFAATSSISMWTEAPFFNCVLHLGLCAPRRLSSTVFYKYYLRVYFTLGFETA